MKSDSAISLHLEHDSAQRYDIFVNSAALVSKLLVLEGAREVAEQFKREDTRKCIFISLRCCKKLSMVERRGQEI